MTATPLLFLWRETLLPIREACVTIVFEKRRRRWTPSACLRAAIFPLLERPSLWKAEVAIPWVACNLPMTATPLLLLWREALLPIREACITIERELRRRQATSTCLRATILLLLEIPCILKTVVAIPRVTCDLPVIATPLLLLHREPVLPIRKACIAIEGAARRGSATLTHLRATILPLSFHPHVRHLVRAVPLIASDVHIGAAPSLFPWRETILPVRQASVTIEWQHTGCRLASDTLMTATPRFLLWREASLPICQASIAIERLTPPLLVLATPRLLL